MAFYFEKDNGMIVEGFICLQYFEMYLYKFGKMTDKNKENRFTIKTRISNSMHLKNCETSWVNKLIYHAGGLIFHLK